MYLITMAHYGEAQGVIENFNLNRINEFTFSSEELVLILTGEGPFEALARTALAIGSYRIRHIINLGIAGTLSEQHQVGDVVTLRTIYLVQENKPAFKTFQSAESGVDCLTSFERILDPLKARQLRGLAQVIDREAWGVAMAAKTAGVSFEAHKAISDVAGTVSACELVKEKAPVFAQLLHEKLKAILSLEKNETKEELPHLPGFHFTFTTGHRFNHLLSKLALKEEKEKDEILGSLGIDELSKAEILPKERARKLLERMEGRIDPFKGQLLNTASLLQKKFLEGEINIHIDPAWENPKIRFSLEAANDQELRKKAEFLKNQSMDSFTKLMEGNFHVE